MHSDHEVELRCDTIDGVDHYTLYSALSPDEEAAFAHTLREEMAQMFGHPVQLDVKPMSTLAEDDAARENRQATP